MSLQAVVISDVHLGSRYCLIDEFLRFMDSLPPGPDLVLNGDIVDRWHHEIPPEHQPGLDAIRRASLRRRVVWVRGNHDDRYTLDRPERVEFAASYTIDKRLHAAHGHDFDNMMPVHQVFIRLFRAMHHLRLTLGAEPVHVAYYAKKFALLYNILRKHVALNAVEYGRENGYTTIVCGHTHHIEDRVVDGIRYLNTGSWTERPVVAAEFGNNNIGLTTLFG